MAKRLQPATFQVSLGYGRSDGTIVGLSCYMYVYEMEEHLLTVSYGRVDSGTRELRLANIESTLPQFAISFFFFLCLSLCLIVCLSLSLCPSVFWHCVTSLQLLLLSFFCFLALSTCFPYFVVIVIPPSFSSFFFTVVIVLPIVVVALVLFYR